MKLLADTTTRPSTIAVATKESLKLTEYWLTESPKVDAGIANFPIYEKAVPNYRNKCYKHFAMDQRVTQQGAVVA